VRVERLDAAGEALGVLEAVERVVLVHDPTLAGAPAVSRGAKVQR
jgi:hypothetical protein